jgi:hypothetical protein
MLNEPEVLEECDREMAWDGLSGAIVWVHSRMSAPRTRPHPQNSAESADASQGWGIRQPR